MTLTPIPTPRERTALRVARVVQLVAEELEVNITQMLNCGKYQRRLLEGRNCVVWMLRIKLGLRWWQVEHVVKRDRATLIYSLQQFNSLLARDHDWLARVNKILAAVDKAERPRSEKRGGRAVHQELESGGYADVAMYERDGSRGTSREELARQNQRFCDAMRRALAEEKLS